MIIKESVTQKLTQITHSMRNFNAFTFYYDVCRYSGSEIIYVLYLLFYPKYGHRWSYCICI